ncbi:MAG TPA: glutamine--tRNA ligase, partial [Caldithrix sp.]|nr:glutamine--tRNA ligase [Caldithrix sp.]
IKDTATGEITELRCTYDPGTKSGTAQDGRKVKATLHWVSVKDAVKAEIRLYEHLFVKEYPDEVEPGQDFRSNLNPNSLKVLQGYVEPSLRNVPPGSRFQFLRLGYFCADPDSTPEKPVFNRTVALRDTWARIRKSPRKL